MDAKLNTTLIKIHNCMAIKIKIQKSEFSNRTDSFVRIKARSAQYEVGAVGWFEPNL